MAGYKREIFDQDVGAEQIIHVMRVPCQNSMRGH
jgi:hypothetical protein